MKKRTLLLVTNYYPFFTGEEYLETEIFYLSKEYSRVIVIPTMNAKGMKITRQLPENCKVLNVNYNLSRMNKLKFLTERTDLYGVKKNNANSILKKMYLHYFEARSMYVFNRICKSDILSKIPSDNVDIYSYWFYVTARVSIQLKEFLKIQGIKVHNLVSRAHRYDLYENESKLKFLPERMYLLKHLDKVYPCSDDGTAHISLNYPAFSNKIETAYLGTVRGSKIKENKSDENIIVSCSGLRKVKRINLLIDALGILDKEGINFKWIHFGDGAEKKKLMNLAKSKINKNKFIFKGNIKNQNLQEWYDTNNVDLFVNVSESEGIPVSIMEVMSRGIPVLATDAGGNRELINNNGVLLDINATPELIANKIEGILHSENYKNLCINSYDIWKKKFNAANNYAGFASELLKNK
jgi:colanic acid/amylovoran biosynthesis glycosyltransferase